MVSYFSVEEHGPRLAPLCFFVSNHAILPMRGISLMGWLLSLPFGLLLIAALPAFGQHHQPLVTFESATVCHGDHGAWRWTAKTDAAPPPETIAPNHHIKPSDIAAWDDPDREVTWRSPRFGREKE
jgi:hypothetical protein